MSPPRRERLGEDARSRVGAGPEVLAELRRYDVDVAVWERSLPTQFSGLEAWAASTMEPPVDRLVPIEPGSVADAVGAAPVSLREALVADVSTLLCHFAAVTGARACRLSFGVIRDSQCRKFHVDAVTMRMVTTYVGPGTEWLPDNLVDRAALARAATWPSDANSQIVIDASGVRRAKAGDVLMLKGSRAENGDGRGALHRSPPLERAVLRVVLVATTGRPPP